MPSLIHGNADSRLKASLSLVVLGILASAACKEAGDPAPVDPRESDDDVDPVWNHNDTGGDGDGLADAPSICEWATSNDSILWGELVDLRLQDSPAIESDGEGGWVWTDAPCPTFNNGHAVELDIRVESVLYGESAESETIVTVHLGSAHRLKLDLMPTMSTAGVPEWVEATDSPFLRNPAWRVGDRIGVPVHYVPTYDIYSLMGEAVFVLGEDGVVFQQHREPFEAGPPTSATGKSLEDLSDAIAGCSPTDGLSRRALVWGVWGPGASGTQRPNRYYAAYCSRPQDEPPDDDAPPETGDGQGSSEDEPSPEPEPEP